MTRTFMQFAAVPLFGLLALSAQADCPYPKAPAQIPSGSSATEQEMIAAMQAFKAYNDDVKAFQTCLDTETKEKAAAGGQTMQFKAMQAKKLAAAVEELEQKAKAFNEQVRIFKAKAG